MSIALRNERDWDAKNDVFHYTVKRITSLIEQCARFNEGFTSNVISKDMVDISSVQPILLFEINLVII